MNTKELLKHAAETFENNACNEERVAKEYERMAVTDYDFANAREYRARSATHRACADHLRRMIADCERE